jgi:hypothetical protein
VSLITKVALSPDERKLVVVFDDGMVRAIDLSRYARKGPAFRRFTDPDYVRGIRPIFRGDILECPDGITLGSDALRRSGTRIDQYLDMPGLRNRKKEPITAR